MSNQSIDAISKALESLGEVWLYLSEYRLTHGHLHLLVTDRNFSKLADVYLSDCTHICGPTSGGPWNVSARHEMEGDARCVVLFTQDGALTIRALRIHIERVLEGH
jgi:hypothetical protein